MAAGELLAHRPDHLQRRGITSSVSVTSSPIFDSFSNPQHAQAVGAGTTHTLARQVRRERLAARKPLDLRGPRRRLFGRQLVLGRARLKLVELQLQLVEKPLLAPSASAISIRPAAGASPAAASNGGGSTTTGTKPPVPPACSRNRRRQLNTRLAFTSLRRATTDTETPGTGSSPLRSGASRHRSSDDEGHPGPARTPDSPLLSTSAIVST